MEKDAIFETAERYVNCTGRSVFLTGKAGTGKTTFLKHICKTTSKRFVVLAPTGVAAINAGGSTIHSFFLLPLCPYLPDVKELVTEYQMPEHKNYFKKERLKIIRTLDLLIIDEISMVRADLLDAVDMRLRKYRKSSLPFGGVQLLMIGDAQQLSPVVKEDERQYMSQVYPSPYFFHSKALQRIDYITIELQKIYRQKDQEFVNILNAIRDNRPTNETMKALNSHVNAFESDEDTIRLTTHNAQADGVNGRKLDMLPGDPVMFEAEVEGDFPENSYPADFVLSLKKDAQVMFIRNDSEGQYYNGKLGRVEDISPKGAVTVRDLEGNSIVVNPVEWHNIQYALNDESGEIEPNIIGKFKQIPLKVAWAITIHKSQGLTFDRVIIDAGAAFAFGQVYVALSRCRSLEGISLDSPIRMSSIYTDGHVSNFNASRPDYQEVETLLNNEEKAYRYDCMRDVFSLDSLINRIDAYRKIWWNNLERIYSGEYSEICEALAKVEDLKKTADTFKLQLSKIEHTQDHDQEYLATRLRKASEYFLPLLEPCRESLSRTYGLEIDNKEIKKKVSEAYNEMDIYFDILVKALKSILEEGFSIDTYNKIKTESLLEERSSAKSKRMKKIVREEGEAGTVNEKLRERLQEWRIARFKKDNIPAYMIMHQTTLMDIAALVPKTKAELMRIKGFGDAKFEKYGEEILQITSEFEREQS